MRKSIELPTEYGKKMEDFIQEVFFAGIKEGIRMYKEALDSPCENKNPDDMCNDCDCWKSFRKYCS